MGTPFACQTLYLDTAGGLALDDLGSGPPGEAVEQLLRDAGLTRTLEPGSADLHLTITAQEWPVYHFTGTLRGASGTEPPIRIAPIPSGAPPLPIPRGPFSALRPTVPGSFFFDKLVAPILHDYLATHACGARVQSDPPGATVTVGDRAAVVDAGEGYVVRGRQQGEPIEVQATLEGHPALVRTVKATAVDTTTTLRFEAVKAAPAAAPARLKIVFFAAKASGDPTLALSQEGSRIEAALRGARYRDDVDFRVESGATLAEVIAVLRAERPHVLHFGGHGGAGGAYRLQGEDGAPVALTRELSDQLFAAFSSPAHHLRLVVINACSSAPVAEAIGAHVDFTIGSTRDLADLDAIEFAETLYGALGDGESIRDAYLQGCVRVQPRQPQAAGAPAEAPARNVRPVADPAAPPERSGGAPGPLMVLRPSAEAGAGVVLVGPDARG
jgi:hypothetical protein